MTAAADDRLAAHGALVAEDAPAEELASLRRLLEARDLQLTVAPRRTVYRPAPLPMSFAMRTALGCTMTAIPLLGFTQLIALWPSVIAATTAKTAQPTMVWLFGVKEMVLSPDGALLILVALVGALASLAEASFRFATLAGRDELSQRWTWTYLLRPVQGASLAVVVYFALRGGLLGSVSGSSTLSPYGLAAFAGLVGLFTRQAFQKLKSVFNELWSVDDLDADIDPDPDVPPNTEPPKWPFGRNGDEPAQTHAANGGAAQKNAAKRNGKPHGAKNGGAKSGGTKGGGAKAGAAKRTPAGRSSKSTPTKRSRRKRS